MPRKQKIFLAILISIALFVGILIGWLETKYVVPIIAYHRIENDINLLTVSPKVFEQQMRILKNNYQVISLDDYIKRFKNGERFNRNTVVITFDDGTVDNYTYAYPVLKKFQLPTIIFLITDSVSVRDEFLTWEQINEMRQDRISFGSHTRSHIYLPKISLEQAHEEIWGSKQILEERFNERINYFAYPIGGVNAQVKKMVEEAGYIAAVSTNQGNDRFNEDVFALNRIRIKDTDLGLKLTMKLSGYYNLFRRLGP